MAKNNATNNFIAFLIGGAIGATLGILFAPCSGKETREKIKEDLLKAKKNLDDIYGAAKEKSNELGEEIKEEIDRLKGKIEEITTKVKEKSKEITEKISA